MQLSLHQPPARSTTCRSSAIFYPHTTHCNDMVAVAPVGGEDHARFVSYVRDSHLSFCVPGVRCGICACRLRGGSPPLPPPPHLHTTVPHALPPRDHTTRTEFADPRCCLLRLTHAWDDASDGGTLFALVASVVARSQRLPHHLLLSARTSGHFTHIFTLYQHHLWPRNPAFLPHCYRLVLRGIARANTFCAQPLTFALYTFATPRRVSWPGFTSHTRSHIIILRLRCLSWYGR